MYSLSRSLPYRLHRLGTRLGSLFARRLASYDLTLPMYQVLVSLAERPDQKLGELAETTSLILPTMSRLIGTMAKRGLVSRERSSVDERYVRINLTPAGTRLAADVRAAAGHYQDVVTDGLDATEVEALKALLDHIYSTLDRLESELPSNP